MSEKYISKNKQDGCMLQAISGWVARESSIESAVLFGSMASSDQAFEFWSDFDLHLICSAPVDLESVDWKRELPEEGFRFQAGRPATGGVRKLTVIFTVGQIDLVIIPVRTARIGRMILRLGAWRLFRKVELAINEMATCLKSGYRFLKGEKQWSGFYKAVAALPGVRLKDTDLSQLADAFLIDFLWINQKIIRGELLAVQHILHSRLSDTNLRLYRELRLRRGWPLPSFGLGRRAETLASANELKWIRLESSLDPLSLSSASRTSLAGLESLMRELVPTWSISPAMREMLCATTSMTPAP